jgi:lysophospholipase L1-like esterase
VSGRKEQNITRNLFLGSFAISGILSVLLILKNPAWTTLSGIIVLVMVLGLILIRHLSGRGKSSDWLLSIAVLNFLILVPELSLRLANFRFESGISNKSESMFGGLRPENYQIFVPDKDLFWKLPSNEPHVNSLGFPGPEIETEKPPNTFRILFLGDSVTQLGFSRYVESFLNSAYGNTGIRFECITLAVAGYSSYQGKILAQLYGTKLNPDLAVVLFGWNDHWLAYHARDSQMRNKGTNGLMWKIYHNLRILQLLNKAAHSIGASKTHDVLNEVRVTESEYRDNLKSIDSVFENEKVPVIFMTSPTAHYRLGVPDYLIEDKYAKSKQDAIRLHRGYNLIVKDFAKKNNAYLLDLENEFDTSPNIQSLFLKDGIHFTRYGMEMAGEKIYNFIARNIIEPSVAGMH